LRAVSLFSGCGGMDLGFQQAGFTIERSADFDSASAAVHQMNLGGDFERVDLTEVDFRRWRDELGTVDVVLGGFPCQGFSKAGPKRADDVRNSLYTAMRDAVKELQPSAFVAENVEGLAQNFGGRYLRLIHEEFDAIGYSVQERLVDAVGFGVPQHRRRIIFVGTLKTGHGGVGEFMWPPTRYTVNVRNGEPMRAKSMEATLHGAEFQGLWELPAPKTISDAIQDLSDLPLGTGDHIVRSQWPSHYEAVIRAIKPGQKLCNVRHGPESVRTWDIPEAFGQTSDLERELLETIARNRRHKRYGRIPNGNPLAVEVIEDLTSKSDLRPVLEDLTRRNFLKEKDGKFDLVGAMFASGLFKRPDWNEPSPTVITDFGNPRYFLHPFRDRPFTVRECARLQGFPDGFEFLLAGVSIGDAYRLIGNAVPPPLSYAIAGQIREMLTTERRRSA